MLFSAFLLCFFFLLWVFFATTATYAFTRLGEAGTTEVLEEHPGRFFYGTFHHFLFPNSQFELLIFASTLAQNLARIGYVICAAWGLYLLGLKVSFPLIVLGIFLLLLIFLFGDFLPRLWSSWDPEKALTPTLPFASFFLYLSLPISFVFLKLAALAMLKRQKNEQTDSLEEMKETVLQILRDANVKGKLNSSDKKLLDSVVKFKDRIVREMMVPRVDLFSLSAETSIREAARELVQEGYSRIPVYKDTIDQIIGVLMFKDVLDLYMACIEGKKDIALIDTPIETIIKGVFYTPETKKAAQLLQEFRTKQMHMAIVVDEYGGTEGVVTMEDILEEIVGEIADEYDSDEEVLFTTQPGGGSWIVDARMSIFDAEETFDIHIPSEGDYDTIGGYIFHKVGSIPQKGLRIHHEDFDLEILSSSERSIEKVRITPRKTAANQVE